MSARPSDDEWTLSTLKEFLEEKLAARDRALELQAEENLRRLNELNHEHARVLVAQQASVSKDTWDGFIKADQTWKGTADRAIQSAVTRTEFQAYRDTTEKALTLKAGQSSGRVEVVNWIYGFIGVVGGIVTTYVMLRGK